jgi:ABC-type Fe3+ transport system substrate-binding protein
MGSMESLVKSYREMPNPQADILTTKAHLLIKGNNDSLKKFGKPMFEPYKTKNLDRLNKELIDPDYLWYTERWFGRALIIHEDAVKKYGEISCLEDLLKWGGSFDYADPIKTGAGFSAVLTFIQNFGGWDEPMGGIEFAKRLERSRTMNHPGTSTMTQMFIRKELDAHWNADIYIWRIGLTKGIPIRAVYPCEGSIYSHNAVSILRGAKHPKAARAWVDHTTSKEIQEWITKTTYTRTAATDVELPPEMAKIPVKGSKNIVYDIPWTKVAENTIEYKKLWQQHVPR